MNIPISQLLVAIGVMMAITFLQKCVPFIALGAVKDNKFVHYLAKQLPPAIMLLLTLYVLKLAWKGSSSPASYVSLAAAAVTAGVHLTCRNTLLSIGIGIFAYAMLQHYLA